MGYLLHTLCQGLVSGNSSWAVKIYQYIDTDFHFPFTFKCEGENKKKKTTFRISIEETATIKIVKGYMKY